MKKKYLKKYMRIEHLTKTLKEERLHLSDPLGEDSDEWEDKNDIGLIDIYKKKNNLEDIRITCMTLSEDRFHFWKIYGKEEEGVCLWFNEEGLKEDIKSENEGLISEMVKYKMPDDLNKNYGLHNLPFTKRQQYIDEEEFRILWKTRNKDTTIPKGIKFKKSSLERIYFNSWLPSDDYKKENSKFKELLSDYGYKNVDTKWNRATDYKKWIKAAKNVQ